MAFPGMMDLQSLARLNDLDPAGEDAAALAARALDADGDGRPDLYLIDLDGDGSVDGVVRAVDADGDGVNDTFIQYGEDGEIAAIGRVDPASGDLDVISEQPDAFDEVLGSLGLADLGSPDAALFTSFEDPYIAETYGGFGDDVPVASAPAEGGEVPPEAVDVRMTEGEEAEAGSGEPPEVVPRIVEIEDRSGGDGSSLWAKVDENADGLADNEVRLDRTSMGTYYGDINKDGYSENVATDLDQDGRIDTVDTTGRGSSADTVGAEQVVEPGSGHLVDRSPGEDDGAAGVDTPADDTGDGADYDAGSTSSADTGGDSDSGGSVSSGGSSDSGSSSGGDESSS